MNSKRKSPGFFYPGTLEEALEYRREGALPVAGGTDVLVKYKSWSGTLPRLPQRPLFVSHLEQLQGVREEDGCLHIGAATTLAALLENRLVPPALWEIISQMASPSIRNAATIGGNIINASPAADTLPYLYATDAEVMLQSCTGKRRMSVADLVSGPGSTLLRDDELLTEIIFCRPASNKYLYWRIGKRKAQSIAKLSVLGLKMDKDDVYPYRIAIGAVAPTVIRSCTAESVLAELAPLEIHRHIEEIIDMYSQLMHPLDDQRSTAFYRKKTALGLIRRLLELA